MAYWCGSAKAQLLCLKAGANTKHVRRSGWVWDFTWDLTFTELLPFPQSASSTPLLVSSESCVLTNHLHPNPWLKGGFWKTLIKDTHFYFTAERKWQILDTDHVRFFSMLNSGSYLKALFPFLYLGHLSMCKVSLLIGNPDFLTLNFSPSCCESTWLFCHVDPSRSSHSDSLEYGC